MRDLRIWWRQSISRRLVIILSFIIISFFQSPLISFAQSNGTSPPPGNSQLVTQNVNGNDYVIKRDVGGPGITYINGQLVEFASDENGTTYYRGTTDNISYAVDDGTGKVTQISYLPAVAAANVANTATLAQQRGADTGTCNLGLHLFGSTNWDACASLFGQKIIAGVSWILWAAGILFNFVVIVTVVHMSDLVTSISAIGIAWKTFRDLANIIFIFVLLYIAISTILRLKGADTKKMLINVIIVALLINFSLFFTKVIIDASNIFSVTFYNSIVINGKPTGSQGALDGGISDAFLEPLKLQTIYSANQATNTNGNNPVIIGNGLWQIIIATFAGSVFIFITALVFLAATFIFVIRFVVLVILMILSPIAFVANVLPKTAGYASMWWKKLFQEALVAPAFFIMIWVVLKIVSDPNFFNTLGRLSGSSSPTNGFNTFLGGGGAGIVVVFNFAIVIGLLIASLVLAKATGGGGANLALQTFHGARKGVQGFIGRNTAGRIGRGLEELANRRQWTNIAPIDALRGVTTRKLATAKFGSSSSRMDAYKHGQELAGKREQAEKAKGYREAATRFKRLEPGTEAYDQARADVERYASRMTASEILGGFSRGELQDDKYIRHFNPAQLKAIYADKEKLSEKEKTRMLKARFAQNEADFKAYTTRLDTETEEVAQASPEYRRLKGELRGRTKDEFELMNIVHPEWLGDENFVPAMRAGTVREIRQTAPWMTRSQRDLMRDAKFSPLRKAIESGSTPAIKTAMLGMTSAEFADLKGPLRKDSRLTKYYDRGILKASIAQQDTIDKVYIVEQLADAINSNSITRGQADQWEWLTSNDRDAKSFVASANNKGVYLRPFDKVLAPKIIHE